MKVRNVLTGMALTTLLLAGCSDSGEGSVKESDENNDVKTEEVSKTNDTSTGKTEVDKETNDDVSSTDGTINDFGKITFEYPSDAQLFQEQSEGPVQLVAYLLNEDGANFNVVSEEIPAEISLEQYVDISMNNTGFEYISDEYFDLNGLKWHEAVSNNQGVKLNQRTFIVDGVAYILTYGATPDAYETHINVFEDITNSVKVK